MCTWNQEKEFVTKANIDMASKLQRPMSKWKDGVKRNDQGWQGIVHCHNFSATAVMLVFFKSSESGEGPDDTTCFCFKSQAHQSLASEVIFSAMKLGRSWQLSQAFSVRSQLSKSNQQRWDKVMANFHSLTLFIFSQKIFCTYFWPFRKHLHPLDLLHLHQSLVLRPQLKTLAKNSPWPSRRSWCWGRARTRRRTTRTRTSTRSSRMQRLRRRRCHQKPGMSRPSAILQWKRRKVWTAKGLNSWGSIRPHQTRLFPGMHSLLQLAFPWDWGQICVTPSSPQMTPRHMNPNQSQLNPSVNQRNLIPNKVSRGLTRAGSLTGVQVSA